MFEYLMLLRFRTACVRALKRLSDPVNEDWPQSRTQIWRDEYVVGYFYSMFSASLSELRRKFHFEMHQSLVGPPELPQKKLQQHFSVCYQKSTGGISASDIRRIASELLEVRPMRFKSGLTEGACVHMFFSSGDPSLLLGLRQRVDRRYSDDEAELRRSLEHAGQVFDAASAYRGAALAATLRAQIEERFGPATGPVRSF